MNTAKIDRLLDIYNDYLLLYKTFNDECYKFMMDKAIILLKQEVLKKR